MELELVFLLFLESQASKVKLQLVFVLFLESLWPAVTVSETKCPSQFCIVSR